MDKKIALVTGANKGIGRAVAEQLAEAGMTVVIAARSAQRGEEAAAALRAAGRDAYAVTLDVTDPGTVTAAAAEVEARFGHLDVLVNNAGISGAAPDAPMDVRAQLPSLADLDVVRAVFETNVFGVIMVTNALLPLLRRAEAGRIVNLSSDAASLTWTSDQEGKFGSLPPAIAYAPSKTAVNAVTVQYAHELREHGILVNAAAPGFCATDINAHLGHRTAAQGAAVVVRLATLDADGPTGGFFSEDGPLPW
ncbi:NAD(P)-dependent dehydrogenase (short-subunit alcohol dehydrogenase family) [Hamadaea flava]|uniref:SDR family NAD(P)-dependent oxidoreductase n=1 Tax=Hamadaea flava TaxID=1742688 RepID=A0ABV8LW36_9ACTN|nr:SDR family NAD(P)-dependent oxidoreductase [Hamadaea flava]MCP2327562.1 NAD(P)-dependent dehydrogenase (short-subunit alcohol dehydrogenase family) [Hamadaea flava]